MFLDYVEGVGDFVVVYSNLCLSDLWEWVYFCDFLVVLWVFKDVYGG